MQDNYKELREDFEELFANRKVVGDRTFKDYCEYLYADIIDFIVNELKSQKERDDRELVEKIKQTQEKYKGVDKRTKEETYSGGGECRSCGKRKDALEISTVISLIKGK